MTEPLTAPEGRPAPRHPAQVRILWSLGIAQMLGGLGTGVSNSMGSIVAYQVTDDESLAGVSRTVALLSAALFGVPLALLAVRLGRRVSLAFGWGVAVLGAVLQVLALANRSLVLLVLGLITFGAAQAGSLQSRFAAADLESPDRRTRSLSLIVWASTVGTVLGPNLTGPGGPIGTWLGVPPIAGTYVIGGVALAGATLAILVGLRPDPLLTAQELHRQTGGTPRAGVGMVAVVRRIWPRSRARFAFVATILNQMVLVTVMTMSAVHLHTHGHGLQVIGLTISLHTLGMFAFSPLVGAYADRVGRVVGVLSGQALNAVALAFCFFAGLSVPLTMAGLFLLGLGWSFGMVSGSALLSESVDDDLRVRAQGTTDTLMNFFAAFGAGAAGPVQARWGFSWLSLLSLCCLVPIVVLGLRVGRRDRGGPSAW